MNYQEAIEYIHNTPKFARVLGNELLTKLLFNLSNPQDKLKFIHIAGTNGKGSCAFMLSDVLVKCGYKVGLYTSPYIETFNERIRVNGIPILDDDLAKLTEKIKCVIEKSNAHVSEFALDTAIALLYFRNTNCDIVILETGLGGRLDATNVIKKSELSLITSIGLDHTQYLGSTIKKIAAEKCGIIKQNGRVICYPDLHNDALSVVKKHCELKKAELTIANMPVSLGDNKFIYDDVTYELKMSGEFQKYNASLAICALNKLKELGYNITTDAISDGLYNAFNPGRLELLKCGIYLDGAHNPSAVESLCKALKAMKKPVRLCLAMMGDKDISGCVNHFANLTSDVIITEVPMPRCANAESIADEFKKYEINPRIIKNPTDAANQLIKEKSDNSISIACGSLYLVGCLRKELR